MRMNISVPDALAEQVRQHDLPVSAICQRALREELAQLQAIERAGDIQVARVADMHLDPDPANWPEIDQSKTHLFYGRNPEHGDGWTLWYHLDESDTMTDHFIPGGANDVEWALRQARTWLRLVHGEQRMTKITVSVGEPLLTIGFTGRWLVEPDSDGTRTNEPDNDAGAYWGIALTQRGRIAVYTAHCNDGWPAHLEDYDSLDQAADHVPADIIGLAARELGEERVLWRDI
jgi:hypothetical protein